MLVAAALTGAAAGDVRAADEWREPGWLGEARPSGAITRVVSLAPNLTEILFALGAGERVVGVTRYDDFPPGVEALPRIGGFADPNLEAILALAPSLVVAVPAGGNRQVVERLAELGTPVLLLPFFSLADVSRSMQRLGAELGLAQQAERQVNRLARRLQRVAKAVAGQPAVQALFVYGHQPLVVAGAGSFADSLLSLAGGNNVAGHSVGAYPTIGIEQVMGRDPAVIIDAVDDGSGADAQRTRARAFWSRWPTLRAVQSGRVVTFDARHLLRPGPRLAQGAEELARALHPEVSWADSGSDDPP